MGKVMERQAPKTIMVSIEVTLFWKLESSRRGKVPITTQGRKSVSERSRAELSGERSGISSRRMISPKSQCLQYSIWGHFLVKVSCLGAFV